jgi:hypothetical protein
MVGGEGGWTCPRLRLQLINDFGQSAVKLLGLGFRPSSPGSRDKNRGTTMKTISMIAADRAFKAISAMSCLGLAVSFSLMALGIDLGTGGL